MLFVTVVANTVMEMEILGSVTPSTMVARRSWSVFAGCGTWFHRGAVYDDRRAEQSSVLHRRLMKEGPLADSPRITQRVR